MKKSIKLLTYFFLAFVVFSCTDDGDTTIEVSLPTDLTATFNIAQDNSGNVTIAPSGEGANSFIIQYGDGTGSSEKIMAGEKIQHTYAQGSYELTVIGFNVNGQTTQTKVPLEVMFIPPTNLALTVTPDENNPLKVTVEATADKAMQFSADFGENPDADPVTFSAGETATYTYADTGTYKITVTASNASDKTISASKEVSVTKPDKPKTKIQLPFDFEGAPEDYVFTEFEGAPTTVIENPVSGGENTSAQVAQTIRAAGAKNYAGAFINLETAANFTDNNKISMKVYSPAAGIPITLRFEEADNSDNGAEAAATTTVANQWETLTFDFSGADTSFNLTKMIVFFNLGTDGQGNTYYFDDIQYAQDNGDGGTGDEIVTPLTFETAKMDFWEAQNVFNGAAFTVIDNPDKSGDNTSEKVTQVVNANGAKYSGGSVTLDKPIAHSGEETTLSVKVWSPIKGPVLLKLESTTADKTVEIQANSTVTEQWETLSFTFKGDQKIDPNEKIDVITLFLNFANAGEGKTYYIDDIQLQ